MGKESKENELTLKCKLFQNTEDEVVISSLELAELLGTLNKKVMDNCRKWLNSTGTLKVLVRKDAKGEERPYYELNKYQFMLYATHVKGFDELKVQIIKDYEAMEKYILESNQSPEFEYFRKTGKILRKDLTDTIKNIMNPSNKFVYSNFTNLVYLKVFGKKAKELKEERGLKKNDNLRDNLTSKELEDVAKIEKQVDSCMTFFDMQGIDKSEYYSRIKESLGIK